MKILVIVELYFHKSKAGGERYLHHFLKELKKFTNYTPIVLLPNSDEMKKYEFDGIIINETTEDLEECRNYICEADLIITQLFASQKVIDFALNENKEIIWILHGYFHGFHKLIANPSITKIFNSKNVLCDFQSKDIEVSNYHIIYPKTDFFKFNQFKDKEKWRRQYITFVNPCKNKGVETVIKLVEENPERKFLIVEGGYMMEEQIPYLQELMKYPNSHIIRNTDNMIKDVYSKSRIILMLSKYESYGLVASESASMGIPVIINRETKGLVENVGKLSLGGYGDDYESYNRCIEILDNIETYFLWSNIYEEKMEERFNEINFQIVNFFGNYFTCNNQQSELYQSDQLRRY